MATSPCPVITPLPPNTIFFSASHLFCGNSLSPAGEKNQYSLSCARWVDRKCLFLAASFSLTKDAAGAKNNINLHSEKLQTQFPCYYAFKLIFMFNIFKFTQQTNITKKNWMKSLVSDTKWEAQLLYCVQPISFKAVVFITKTNIAVALAAALINIAAFPKKGDIQSKHLNIVLTWDH